MSAVPGWKKQSAEQKAYYKNLVMAAWRKTDPIIKSFFHNYITATRQTVKDLKCKESMRPMHICIREALLRIAEAIGLHLNASGPPSTIQVCDAATGTEDLVTIKIKAKAKSKRQICQLDYIQTGIKSRLRSATKRLGSK